MVGDVYAVRWEYSVAGEHCTCRLHFLETAACNAWNPALALCRAQVGLWPIPIPFVPTSVHYDRVYARRVFPGPGMAGETYPADTGQLPLLDVCVPAAPMIVSFTSGDVLPIARGRIYWSGYAEEDQFAGQLDSLVPTVWAAWTNAFLAERVFQAPDLSGRWRPCLWQPHYESPRPIRTAIIRPALGTMRTRLRRQAFFVP